MTEVCDEVRNSTRKEVLFESLNVGDEIPKLVKEAITETQLVMYSGASGDFHPLHTVHSYAEKAGFGGVVAHGMLVMAFVGQVITDWVGVKPLTMFSVEFKGISRPGDIITCKGKISQKYIKEGRQFVDIDLVAENQRMEKVVTARASVILGSKTRF